MHARQHMLDGIARMNERDWPTALDHFEQAAEIRQAGSWRDDPDAAWVLAAAWINRSDVLRHLGRTGEAILSLDRAIDAMAHIPLEKNPDCADRLILAWINRGTACGEAGNTTESLVGFSEAETLWERWGGGISPGRLLMASMLHANRARVLLDLGHAADGWQSACTAVRLLENLELDGTIAEASIKARGILCHALAMMLDEPGGIDQAKDWIAVATDSAEEALTLTRATGYRGEWVPDLVRYGAKIYRVCQPHFLGEFIRDWVTGDSPLASDQNLKREMANELLLAKVELESRVRLRPHDTGYVERALQVLASLQLAEGQLAANPF